ncbi:hypothetical protein DSO57_1006252 [Entomophthora muscae]|uniref:Uncharacterized protein n=1 Tax=Entomophthora muscae TaxID=34485 RepID=A0ACC2TV28_9FUNG|nr:hypothetical protein DSO57_1006252 [Entomophthora muscae]
MLFLALFWCIRGKQFNPRPEVAVNLQKQSVLVLVHQPEHTPTFKQIFNPKTSTIAAFLTIYKTALRRATDELKKEHIFTCLHPTCQEVVVPKLPSIVTWEDMKRLLIEEFGGDLSLEVKKDAFMHIAFKPKETLDEFADCFYIKGQQLITSQQLTPWEAYTAF